MRKYFFQIQTPCHLNPVAAIHVNAIQWIQQLIKFSAIAHALRGPVQPSVKPIGTQEQNPDEVYERLLHYVSAYVYKMSLR